MHEPNPNSKHLQHYINDWRNKAVRSHQIFWQNRSEKWLEMGCSAQPLDEPLSHLLDLFHCNGKHRCMNLKRLVLTCSVLFLINTSILRYFFHFKWLLANKLLGKLNSFPTEEIIAPVKQNEGQVRRVTVKEELLCVEDKASKGAYFFPWKMWIYCEVSGEWRTTLFNAVPYLCKYWFLSTPTQSSSKILSPLSQMC